MPGRAPSEDEVIDQGTTESGEAIAGRPRPRDEDQEVLRSTRMA